MYHKLIDTSCECASSQGAYFCAHGCTRFFLTEGTVCKSCGTESAYHCSYCQYWCDVEASCTPCSCGKGVYSIHADHDCSDSRTY